MARRRASCRGALRRRAGAQDQEPASGLLYSQLAGAESLRDIVGALESHAPRLYHLGAAKVSRSTLSDATTLRCATVFTGLFARLAAQALSGLRKKMREPLHLIDSTSLGLSALSADWARFSATACGAKLHVAYDPDADCPLYAALSGPKGFSAHSRRSQAAGSP
jgi:hypothetical protein